ncbi:efflux RND transporter periplasmic adaptor subunit [Proteocatella sphenisci]|uniref:efflux RND transporter periplasmic adaptor subunit n=1 Tax=Proteocatella sphenisci TaxID=181070 RepID=UPI0004909D11|nr:HlyD family efflux transporter periplasmic adaptor subunit [Proteocatella sphenisci]
MKKKIITIIIIAAVAVSAAAYITTRPTKVAYTLPVRQTYVQSVLASGEIAADESVTVISEAAGKVTDVIFSEGGQIQAFQEMAKIESQSLQNTINEKTAALSAAQSNYNAVITTNYDIAAQEVKKLTQELEIQKREYQKNLSLFESGGISQAQLQTFKDTISKLETDLKASEIRMKSYAPGGSEARKQGSAIEQARTNLNSSRSDISKYSIKSPFAGVIVQKFISQGEIIQNGAPIAEIAKSGKKYAEIKVDEKNAVYVKKGQKAYVYPSSNPEKKVESKVSWISPVVDKTSGTILVKIEIPEASKSEFLLSMTVTAELVTKEFPQALVVDATYIMSDDTSSYIFVKNADRAEQIPVIVEGEGAYVMISQKAAAPSSGDTSSPASDTVISQESILLYPEKLKAGDKVATVETGGN